jgi:hypothetical protein
VVRTDKEMDGVVKAEGKVDTDAEAKPTPGLRGMRMTPGK